MAGLVHVFACERLEDVDARDERGHDASRAASLVDTNHWSAADFNRNPRGKHFDSTIEIQTSLTLPCR
jgi:hypothetical protein